MSEEELEEFDLINELAKRLKKHQAALRHAPRWKDRPQLDIDAMAIRMHCVLTCAGM